MNLALVDLNLLVALDALLTHGRVGDAARAICLSQPAMSHALARLRELLGDPLLVRSGGVSRLTPRAVAMRPRVRDALDVLVGVLEAPTFDPATSSRRFTAMLSDYTGALVVPTLLRTIADEAPHAVLDVVAFGPDPRRERERLAEVDFAMTCEPGDYPWLRRRRVFRDRDALISSRRGDTPPSDIDAVLSAPHVAVVEHEHERDPVDVWLGEVGRRRRVIATVPQYLLALQLVSRSDALAIVPERLARHHAEALDLRVSSVPLDVGFFDEYVIHDERQHRDPGAAWLRAKVLEAAPPPLVAAPPKRGRATER